MSERAALVLGPSAAELRRDLGPVAWSALEVITTQSVGDGGVLVARVGVRRLAEEMGVATNTAARAARALLGRGLLVRSQKRAISGRFERGLYELVLPPDTLVVGHRVEPSRRARDVVARRLVTPSPTLAVEQLALLPE